jgi:hypothetical protein
VAAVVLLAVAAGVTMRRRSTARERE